MGHGSSYLVQELVQMLKNQASLTDQKTVLLLLLFFRVLVYQETVFPAWQSSASFQTKQFT